jgi:hypothetical protein
LALISVVGLAVGIAVIDLRFIWFALGFVSGGFVALALRNSAEASDRQVAGRIRRLLSGRSEEKGGG